MCSFNLRYPLGRGKAAKNGEEGETGEGGRGRERGSGGEGQSRATRVFRCDNSVTSAGKWGEGREYIFLHTPLYAEWP